jgi:MFS family permease
MLPEFGPAASLFSISWGILLVYSLPREAAVVPFALVDHRGLPPIEAGLVFLPFTLGVGLLSQLFGRLADVVGPRAMLIAGPVGAGIAYGWMALGQRASLVLGVIVPMALLGISFAVLVAPLTASVLSSVEQPDEGLASGINNAASRVAQLIGVAIGAGVGSFVSGYEFGLMVAGVTSIAGALTIASTASPTPAASRVLP